MPGEQHVGYTGATQQHSSEPQKRRINPTIPMRSSVRAEDSSAGQPSSE